jgi:hypothetical protein
MATSKSHKRPAEWAAGALVFSGRPNPNWRVEEHLAKQLQQTWASLEPCARSVATAPALGYQGVFLRDASGREWLAYGGMVRLKTKKGSQSRRDRSGTFEKLLLASAPAGLLPEDVIRPSQRDRS